MTRTSAILANRKRYWRQMPDGPRVKALFVLAELQRVGWKWAAARDQVRRHRDALAGDVLYQWGTHEVGQ